MKNKNNDFWLLIIALIFIPVVLIGFFVGSWLQNMSLIDRVMIMVPIFLVLIFLAINKK